RVRRGDPRPSGQGHRREHPDDQAVREPLHEPAALMKSTDAVTGGANGRLSAATNAALRVCGPGGTCLRSSPCSVPNVIDTSAPSRRRCTWPVFGAIEVVVAWTI